MTQKEAIISALKHFGGKAMLSDIYRVALSLGDFSGSQKPKATIRSYLLKDTDTFRNSNYGEWELVSYQEELASRDRLIKELEEEIAILRTVKTEDDFVKRLVRETKNLYKHEKSKIEVIRQILYKVGRSDAEEELDAWIEGKMHPSALNVQGDYVVNNNMAMNNPTINGPLNDIHNNDNVSMGG